MKFNFLIRQFICNFYFCRLFLSVNKKISLVVVLMLSTDISMWLFDNFVFLQWNFSIPVRHCFRFISFFLFVLLVKRKLIDIKLCCGPNFVNYKIFQWYSLLLIFSAHNLGKRDILKLYFELGTSCPKLGTN